MNKDSVLPAIHRLVDDRIAAGALVHVPWVASAILAERPDITGADAAFYRDCTFKEVTRLVTSAIGKYERALDSTPAQLVFPGFKHLVKAYPVTRGDQALLVPVDQCTDAELRARADQLKKMAAGCQAHARELLEYVSARAQYPAAPERVAS